MIGVFDSGVGGLTILKSIHKKLPEYSTIYLGDNARAPYGDLSQEQITAYTWEGVRFLFESGCSLVVLACNTASAQALQTIQQEYLRPDSGKKVLGIIRPTVEAMSELGQERGNLVTNEVTKLPQIKALGIFATQATVDSEIYLDEFKDQKSELEINQQACPGWVMMIENGEDKNKALEIIKADIDKLFSQNSTIDAVLLACTHYPFFHDQVVQSLPAGIKVFDQGDLVADKLVDYIKRHTEINDQLDRTSKRQFFTTGKAEHVSKVAETIVGEKIDFEHIDLNAESR